MVSAEVKFGAKQAIVNCLKVQRGEKMAIITDKDTDYLAATLYDEAKNAGAEVVKFIMENYGSRPDDGSTPLRFPDEIADTLKNCTVSIYVAQGKKGELESFRIPMLKIVEEMKIRHGHMPNFIEAMMGQGMASDYAQIQDVTKKVHDIVSKARKIRVTSRGGSDFTADIDNDKYRWVLCDGNIKPGAWSNLPDGEIFTFPADINGRVVVDGCFGDFFNKKYGDISSTPLTYELKNGRCVKGSVKCANAELKKEFEEYTFNTDENSDRLGEFAIGTNLGLKKLISNLLQDEKFPGVHLALGSPYPDKTGADWTSNAHNDGILRDVTIEVDGKVIMKDSKFTAI
ncbi:MAG TPA: aminopeptidase [bacterium]|jgi:leucyl aminopeptidase (aminopeptidase T)|nr:aminopeptidase [Myxococcales bacterium]OQA62371.1 MAG: Thermophilic metalloprotease (M29) [bacterium ADurb.Bin270]HPW45865.1 aminopeptidase [bacterium]HQG12991.1 aminopeptidase [bacterium]HQH80775.1 aminopeptidase [bacterium]